MEILYGKAVSITLKMRKHVIIYKGKKKSRNIHLFYRDL